jgi:dTDP-4-amino-4,6-dideoxygalactose transaminase
MVTTNSDALAEKVHMLCTHGWKKKYFPEVLGYNSRLDELQAAILRVKLRHVDAWNARRSEIAQHYTARLGETGLQVPLEAQDRSHVYHLYILRSASRAEFQQQLKERGVASEVYYPQPLHLAAPCRKPGWAEQTLPAAEQASSETVAIPLYPEMTPEQIEAVVVAVEDCIPLKPCL